MQLLYKKSTFTESIWGWLMREDASTTYENSQLLILGVHRQILDTLEQGGVPFESALMHRLTNATELQDVWYARTDIMQVLCKLHGEAAAWDIMDGITPMFEGFIPPSLFKRVPSHRKDAPPLWKN